MPGKRKKRAGVYALVNRASGLRYVGSSRDLTQRKCDHLKTLRKGTNRNRHLQEAFIADGEGAFEWVVLLFCDEADCVRYEQEAMDHYGYENLYNLKPKSGQSGAHCFETKKLMSAIAIETGGGFCGHKHTEEAKVKIRSWGRGRPKSLEMRRKLSEKNKGKRPSQATIDAITGAKNPQAKLTEEAVRQIRARVSAGDRQHKIAKDFGVTQTTVSEIHLRKKWRHVV